jgi:phage terminase large subunit-like protein
MMVGCKMAHGGHPVLRWNADNLVVRLDANANMAPDKAKARQKIDGIVSLIMAIGRATAGNEAEEEITDVSQILSFG